MKRPPMLGAKRVVQTVTAFENGPQILLDLLRRTPELEYRTKTGLKIVCPNIAGARVPLYELYAEDVYRTEDILAGLPEDLTVLDIGGHIGCFSMSIAQAAPRARIFTHEASPSTIEFLKRNVATNSFGSQITVQESALSDHHGTLTFASNTLASGLNGITSPAPEANVVEVPCVTFAEAVAGAGGTVHLVKMDVEGAEYPIILSSSPEDWSTVQRVAMEFHGVPGKHWHELRDFFVAAGFTLRDSDFGGEGFGMLWLEKPAVAGR